MFGVSVIRVVCGYWLCCVRNGWGRFGVRVWWCWNWNWVRFWVSG